MAIKNQVAGTRLSQVAADEIGVVLHQRPRVRELGEAAVVDVFCKKRPWANAEEVSAQWGLGIGVLLDRGGDRLHGMCCQPRFVVGVERFAIRKAQQGRAVVDLGGYLGQVRLSLSDAGEPAAERLAVLDGVQAEKIRRSVAIAVIGVEGKGYRNEQKLPATMQMQLDVAGIDGG